MNFRSLMKLQLPFKNLFVRDWKTNSYADQLAWGELEDRDRGNHRKSL